MIKIKNPHLVNFGSVLCFNMLIMTRLMDELLHAVFASPDARDSLLHLLLSLHQRWFALEFKFINVMNSEVTLLFRLNFFCVISFVTLRFANTRK